MALRKPLVQVNGQIQQLQAGDTLDASVTEVDLIDMTNDNVGSISKGQPVYVSSAGSVDLAQADAAGTKSVVGFVYDTSIATATTGSIQTDGVIEVADWTSIAGSATLTAGSKYYLSDSSPGEITSTAPTTSGNYVVPIGTALSTTELEITIEPTILL